MNQLVAGSAIMNSTLVVYRTTWWDLNVITATELSILSVCSQGAVSFVPNRPDPRSTLLRTTAFCSHSILIAVLVIYVGRLKVRTTDHGL